VCAVFFHIRDLEVRPAVFDVQLPAGAIDFLDPKICQNGLLRAMGRAELVSSSLDEIRVKGHVTVQMEAECDRCLEPAACPVDGDFELCYRPVAEGYGGDTMIDPSEAEMGFYEGGGVELNDVLREYVLLSMPMQRLCRAGCKGMCPVCGKNRNLSECHCPRETSDDRWAALKSIRN
jgi:DUF177 domain-containing protein